MNSRKLDCQLTALDSSMEPIGQASGLINLFEQEYDGFTFWHGTSVFAQVQLMKSQSACIIPSNLKAMLDGTLLAGLLVAD